MNILNIFNWISKRTFKELEQHDKEYEEMKERNQQFSEEVRARMAAKEIEFAKRKERNSRMFSSFRKDNK
ncbi:hypothetical protein CCZ20_24575 [Priestia aryabhattai]|uniref:hypothetical protein n=1 Tax=Priestia aryabhattai TaxID=412384 RepID=UPI000B5118BD|nr:hypothetical protein [Priestia aryabhattai]OVE34829.1 hypothetical protein CCZ20_24575 [Priestia aryabhattai]